MKERLDRSAASRSPVVVRIQRVRLQPAIARSSTPWHPFTVSYPGGIVDDIHSRVPGAGENGKKAEYTEIAEKSWALFQEYGAIGCCEGWGTDVPDGEVTSFPLAVRKEADETVVFSWILWPDKATADACIATMESDPRWEEAMPNASEVFSLKRMIFGGFEPLIER